MELKEREQVVKDLQEIVDNYSGDWKRFNVLDNALSLIKELTDEIKDLEADYDRVYEQAEADIRGNMADGGTSCHWCIAGHRADAVKEMLGRAIDKAVLKAYDDDTERLFVGTWKLRDIAKEMLEESK